MCVCGGGGCWAFIHLFYLCDFYSECPADPPDVSLAQLVKPGSREIGLTVTYACNTGYIMEGSPDVTCKTSGEWTEAQFHCRGTCIHCYSWLFQRVGRGRGKKTERSSVVKVIVTHAGWCRRARTLSSIKTLPNMHSRPDRQMDAPKQETQRTHPEYSGA